MQNIEYLIAKGLNLTPFTPKKHNGDAYEKKAGVIFKEEWTTLDKKVGNAMTRLSPLPFYAVLTGEISNIIGVDIDNYKVVDGKVQGCPEFEELCAKSNTYTVKTPTGGYHYYFKYDSDIKSTTIFGYVDVQSDGKCLIAPNIKRTDGTYEVINEAPILEMPNDIKTFILGKSMVEISPAATNEKANKKPPRMTSAEMKRYLKERQANRAIVSWKEFEKLCQHLKPELVRDYKSWCELGWAMSNVSEDNNYRDEGFKLFDKISQLCPEKYNDGKISCADIYFEARNEGARLGWTHLTTKCVDSNYKPFNFIDEEENKDYKSLLDAIESLKDENIHSNAIAKLILQYLKEERGNALVYDSAAKMWAVCNEHNIWQEEETLLYVRRICKDLIAMLFGLKCKEYKRKAAHCDDKEEKKDLMAISKKYGVWEVKCSTPKDINQIVACLEADLNNPDFIQDKLDSNPYIFAFTNKLFDTQTCEFRDIRPEDCVMTNAGYPLPERNEEYIEEVKRIITSTPPDKASADYLIGLKASFLAGVNPDEKVYIETGRGRNGKSIVNEPFKKAYGKYYMECNPEVITKPKKSANETSELFASKGKRVVNFSEPDSGHDNKIQAAKIKALTSEELTARGLFKNPITFTPQFNINILCNDIPLPSKTDKAFDERILIIPYPFVFTKNEQEIKQFPDVFKKMDTSLREKIRTDLKYRDGMIWLLLDTFIANKGKTLVQPKISIEATNQYLCEGNEVIQFMMNETSKVEGRKIETKELFRFFRASNKDSNISTVAVFGKRLSEAGYKVKQYGHKKISYVFNVVYGLNDVEMIDSDDNEPDSD